MTALDRIKRKPAKGIVHVWDDTLLDPTVTVSNGDTLSFTYTASAGEWIVFDPDMTDWPTDDIIDHYAHKLAKKRPAQ